MTDAFPRVAPFALLVVVLLSGCETQQGRVESSSTPVAAAMAPSSGGGAGVITGAGTYMPPGVKPPLEQNYPRSIQESGAGPAVLSLYRQAQDARANGHPEQAAALLDRAVHIDARNAFVWQAIAGVRMEQKLYDDVENFAKKSSSVARGNPYVEAGNWRLIASARQARGDSGGAVQAQAQADTIARALSQN